MTKQEIGLSSVSSFIISSLASVTLHNLGFIPPWLIFPSVYCFLYFLHGWLFQPHDLECQLTIPKFIFLVHIWLLNYTLLYTVSYSRSPLQCLINISKLPEKQAIAFGPPKKICPFYNLPYPVDGNSFLSIDQTKTTEISPPIAEISAPIKKYLWLCL